MYSLTLIMMQQQWIGIIKITIELVRSSQFIDQSIYKVHPPSNGDKVWCVTIGLVSIYLKYEFVVTYIGLK